MISLPIACALLAALPVAAQQPNKPRATHVSDTQAIRGIIKPHAEAVISSEIQARITRLPFRDGQRFRKGDVLIHFDCARYLAELKSAEADYRARQKTLENSIELQKLNAIGTLEVDIARADVQKAMAVTEIAGVMVSHCRIRAPFSGKVVTTLVNPHESVNPYDKLINILDDSRFSIELILPSTALRWLKTDAPFTFAIDDTQDEVSARVTDIGASIDPVSQTVRVMGKFTTRPKGILAGMSGSAIFPSNPTKATKNTRSSRARGALASKRRVRERR